jgi:hypothetical protein
MNMWRSDMDEEDFENAMCEGDCEDCSECEQIIKGE